jgi:hypothetical protein
MKTTNTTTFSARSGYASNIGNNNRKWPFIRPFFVTAILLFSCAVNAQVNNDKRAADLENFKSTWMAKHQLQSLNSKQYEQMKSEWSQTNNDPQRVRILEPGEPKSPEREKQLKNWQGENFPSGFPVMEKTGNPKKDQAVYDAKKQAWIEKNPELYKKMTSANPIMTEQERAERQGVLKNQNK